VGLQGGAHGRVQQVCTQRPPDIIHHQVDMERTPSSTPSTSPRHRVGGACHNAPVHCSCRQGTSQTVRSTPTSPSRGGACIDSSRATEARTLDHRLAMLKRATSSIGGSNPNTPLISRTPPARFDSACSIGPSSRRTAGPVATEVVSLGPGGQRNKVKTLVRSIKLKK